MKSLAAALAFALTAAAPPDDFTAARDAPAVMEAVVSPVADGRFRATLRLREDAPVWIFLRSNLPMDAATSWRQDNVRVLTSGVELVRIGYHDALVASDGGDLPREIVLGVTPFTGLLNADYQPAIRLGPGSIALFSDHFTLRPAASRGAVEELGASWTSLPDYDAGHPLVHFRGPGFVADGRPAAEVTPTRATYVVSGTIRPGGNDALVTYLDAELPPWLADELSRDIPAILSLYERRWGPHEESTPELLVEWAGANPRLVSLGGSVIGAQIVMRLEGAQLLSPTGGADRELRHFIAHEAAHFWLGELVAYGAAGDAWTSEGGADLAALRAIEAVDPQAGSRREARATRIAWNQCVAYLQNGSLVTAPDRGEQQAFYGCGFLLSRVAEAAAMKEGEDFFDYWNALIERHRDVGRVSQADWIAELARRTGDPAIPALVRRIATEPLDDPAVTLASLFERSGLPVPAAQ